MSETGLTISGLSAGYRGREILRDLALGPLPRGEVTALVGPNAAGKSTLLRSLAGLVRARGRAALDGADLLTMKPAERARRVAFMPQALPQRGGLTVLEGVIAALKASPAALLTPEADAQAAALAALDRLGIVPLAMETLDRISGGQRQLASLAQALVRDPRLLLLDEPTSALDPRHQLAVMGIVRELSREGRTVVVVLHDLNLAARWSDRIAVLGQGRIRAFGRPEEALSPQILSEVYGIEARVERCSAGTLQIIADALT